MLTDTLLFDDFGPVHDRRAGILRRLALLRSGQIGMNRSLELAENGAMGILPIEWEIATADLVVDSVDLGENWGHDGGFRRVGDFNGAEAFRAINTGA